MNGNSNNGQKGKFSSNATGLLTGRHRNLEGEERELYNFIDRYPVGLIFLGDQFLTNIYFSIKAAQITFV